MSLSRGRTGEIKEIFRFQKYLDFLKLHFGSAPCKSKKKNLLSAKVNRFTYIYIEIFFFENINSLRTSTSKVKAKVHESIKIPPEILG